jgi:hypothetical protein
MVRRESSPGREPRLSGISGNEREDEEGIRVVGFNIPHNSAELIPEEGAVGGQAEPPPPRFRSGPGLQASMEDLRDLFGGMGPAGNRPSRTPREINGDLRDLLNRRGRENENSGGQERSQNNSSDQARAPRREEEDLRDRLNQRRSQPRSEGQNQGPQLQEEPRRRSYNDDQGFGQQNYYNQEARFQRFEAQLNAMHQAQERMVEMMQSLRVNQEPRQRAQGLHQQQQAPYFGGWEERQSNTRPSPPRPFGNAEGEDPALFLVELDNFVASYPPHQQMIQAIRCFREESDAALWVNGIGVGNTDYPAFRNAFIRKYLGVEAQREIRLQLETGRYTRTGNTSRMAQYFLRLRAKCRRLELDPAIQLSDEEFLVRIARHFPIRVGDVLFSLAYQPDSVSRALRRLEQMDQEENARYQAMQNRQQPQGNQPPPNNRYHPGNGRGGPAPAPQRPSNPENRTAGSRGISLIEEEEEKLLEMEMLEDDDILDIDMNEDSLLMEEEEQSNLNVNHVIASGKELLEEEDWSPNTSGSVARVSGKIGNVSCEIIVDSGSDICIVSPEIFEEIKQDGLPFRELKTGNIYMKGPFKNSRKNKPIAQILLEVKLGNQILPCVFLVAELDNQMCPILGDNFLQHYQVIVDYGSKLVSWEADGVAGFVSFSNNPKNTKNYSIQCVGIEDELEEKIQKIVENAREERKLSSAEADRFYNVLSKHRQIFSDKPGKTEEYVHKIHIRDPTPFYIRPYRVPEVYKPKVQEELKKMMDWGIIERSTSPYVSPMVVVLKPDKTLRLCLDLRRLNSQLWPEHDKPMEIDEILGKFEGMRFYSLVDMISAYWQLPIHPDHQRYVAFSLNNQVFCFKRLVFGLSTAVSSFTRAMELILGPKIMKTTIIYIDDVLSIATSFDQHMKNLEKLLTRMMEAGFTLRLEKCQFLQEKIQFVGHEISPQGIRPKEATLNQIMNYPVPRNIKTTRGFLGITSWLRRFIPHLAEMSNDLHQLTSEKSKFTWLEKHQLAFERIKLAASEIKMLGHPCADLPLHIQTDGSGTGLAACMFQLEGDGSINLLQHASRVLRGPELNYSTTEIEALAIIFAMKKWEFFLIGRKFILHTDNQALTYLKLARPPNARLTRFLLYLQQFDFTVQHVKGIENYLPDYLSRNPAKDPSEIAAAQKSSTIQIYRIRAGTETLKKIQEIGKIQDQQLDLKILKQTLEETGSDGTSYLVQDNVLFKEIKEFFHDAHGHFGVARTKALAEVAFYHPQLRKHIKSYVKKCDLCQRTKFNNQKMSLDYRTVVTSHPGEIVSSDLYGPLPKSTGQATYILVLYDLFSKLVKFYPLRKATTQTVLNRYGRYLEEAGKPEVVLSDQGTQYTSKAYIKKMAEWGIKIRHSSVRHPVGNAVERIMKEIGRLGRAYCHHSHAGWASHLKDFEEWINSSISLVTQLPPKMVHFGSLHSPIQDLIVFPKDANPPPTHQEIIEKTREKIVEEGKRRLAKHPGTEHQEDRLDVGDLVLLKTERISSAWDKETKKFKLLFEGPFEIRKKIHRDTFVLEDPITKQERGIFNRRLIKKYFH